MMEAAAIGLAVLTAAAALTAVAGSRRRDELLVVRLGVALVAIAGFAYLLSAPALLARQLLLLLGLTIWAALHSVRVWREPPRLPVKDGQLQTAGLPVTVARLFLASAPMLVVAMDRRYLATRPSPLQWDSLTWIDGMAVALWSSGLLLTLAPGRWRKRRQTRFRGELLMAWSFYVLALSVPAGYLTLFAPLILARHLGRFAPEKNAAACPKAAATAASWK